MKINSFRQTVKLFINRVPSLLNTVFENQTSKLNLKGQSSQQTENNHVGFSDNCNFSVQTPLNRRKGERSIWHV